MPTEHPANDPAWTPPQLIHTITGHLFTGVLKLVVVALIFWVAAALNDSMSARLGPTIGLLVSILLVSELLAVIIERPFVIRGRLNEPGGWGYSLLPLLAYLLVGLLLSFLTWHNSVSTLVFGVIYAAVTLAIFVLLKPWQPGETQAETDAKFAEFKTMTRQHFDDDVVEIKRRARERTKNSYYAQQEKKRQRSEPKDQD